MKEFEAVSAEDRAACLIHCARQVGNMLRYTEEADAPPGEDADLWETSKSICVKYGAQIHAEMERQANAAHAEFVREVAASLPSVPSREECLGDIYEYIAEGLAAARTKALLQDQTEARENFNEAARMFHKHKAALETYPGWAALEQAFTVTLQAFDDVPTYPAISPPPASQRPLLAGRGKRRRNTRNG